MINVISTKAHGRTGRGPFKVFSYLAKGLDRIGYPYVLNRDLNATRRLWIHDDVTALRCMARSRALKVVGPNLFVMPTDIPKGVSFDGAIYLQPSEWAVRVWDRAGFDACPMVAWPVGIDADLFRPSSVPLSDRQILVYHKRRDPSELDLILRLLREMRLPFSLARYGEYDEATYRHLLATTSFVIWHGCHESQGIALQEAMACDVPIVVCDATSLSQEWGGGYSFDPCIFDMPVSSAPYFSEHCGVKITDLADLREAIERMQDTRASFQPRQYVLNNLSLEKQARVFVSLWQRWGMTSETGVREILLTQQTWKPPMTDRLSQKCFNVTDKWRRAVATRLADSWHIEAK